MKDNICSQCQGVKVRMVPQDRICWCRFQYLHIDAADNIYPLVIKETHPEPLESPQNDEKGKNEAR